MRKRVTRSDFRTGLGAALLVLLVLALQYAGTFYAIEVTRLSKEAELERHLTDLGTVAQMTLGTPALALDEMALSSIFESQARTDAGETAAAADIYAASLPGEITAPIAQFADRARLRQVLVLSPEGRVLFDSMRTERLLERYDFWEIDSQEVAAALGGKVASTPSFGTEQGMSLKRTYVPVSEIQGEPEMPGAVVALVAGRDYLGSLQKLTGHLRYANAFVTVLMMLIGVLIYRLARSQRRAERQAGENERLAALGRLAAGFAHELRNPLGIIRAFTEDLEQTLRVSGGNPEAVDACEEIIEEVDRMNRLVGQFLGYSRGRRPGQTDGQAAVLDAVESVLSIVRPSAEKQGLALRVEHAPALRHDAARWQVNLDEGALRQVLMNLILNAIEVSPRGGLIRVGIEAAARHMKISVTDQGPGISKADRSRIFEPFYTTREGGSGLGLAISRQIVAAASGLLEVGPPPAGGGATFILQLGRAADATQRPANDTSLVGNRREPAAAGR